MKFPFAALLLALLLAGCGPDGGTEFSPSAHCVSRCRILFECLEIPTGPSDRDREEFAECVDDCTVGLARECEFEAALECTDCWKRRTCDEVTTGRCDAVCFGLCES